eukprot:264296_1
MTWEPCQFCWRPIDPSEYARCKPELHQLICEICAFLYSDEIRVTNKKEMQCKNCGQHVEIVLAPFIASEKKKNEIRLDSIRRQCNDKKAIGNDETEFIVCVNRSERCIIHYPWMEQQMDKYRDEANERFLEYMHWTIENEKTVEEVLAESISKIRKKIIYEDLYVMIDTSDLDTEGLSDWFDHVLD